MPESSKQNVLIVDDEASSDLMRSIRRHLSLAGYETTIVESDIAHPTGEDFELEAIHAVEVQQPAAVILDVRFGEHPDDQFKGLSILTKLISITPDLPVLVFSQYASGPYRETAVAASLNADAPVDFIDKFASPEEVVLRLRRLIGAAPETLKIGSDYVVDVQKRIVFGITDGQREPIRQIQGMKFEILVELANSWYRSPGELVPYWKLERFSEGDDSRASLRVRIREIKDALGTAADKRLGPDDLIVSVRGRGYLLVPLRD
jgi:DNA-binding response OmpR family regulator